MGDVPLVTDASLTARDASRYSLRLADGVNEGYAAIYEQTPSEQVIVYALRFATTAPTSKAMLAGDATRIDFGYVVALVTGNRGQCFRAVETFLQSLDR
jgi:hypothetical protein